MSVITKLSNLGSDCVDNSGSAYYRFWVLLLSVDSNMVFAVIVVGGGDNTAAALVEKY